MGNRIVYFFDTFFGEYPLTSDTVSGGILLVLGDTVSQGIERQNRKRQHRRRSGHEDNEVKYHSTRSSRVFIIGCFIGLFSSKWYDALDIMVTDKEVTGVIKKILWDQAIAGPFFSTVFIVAMGILEFRKPSEIWEEWTSKFIEIYMTDWLIWPLAQSINFSFVAPRYRVVYVHMVTLCWDTYLSYTKHKVMEEQKQAVVGRRRSTSRQRSRLLNDHQRSGRSTSRPRSRSRNGRQRSERSVSRQRSSSNNGRQRSGRNQR